MPMQTAPLTRASNEVDDFVAGGIYPGGTGIIQDISYTLWDYNGTQPPNSQCAVKLMFQPTDGSNENKPVEIYWSCGPATTIQPDPGHAGFALGVFHTNSNWWFVLQKLKDGCGLQRGALSAADGIRVLIGSEMTLARVDPPKRDGMPSAAPTQPGQQQPRVNQILIPTRVKFAWEKTQSRGRGRAAEPAAAPATPSAPPAATNGNSSDADIISSALTKTLTDNGGSIPMDDLVKLMTPNLKHVPVAQRVEIMKLVKSPGYMVDIYEANGFTADSGVIS
jgi:hypothetical protein